MVENLAPMMMCISNQHYLLSSNRKVQDSIFFFFDTILHMAWTLMRKKRTLIISSSCFVNHMRQRKKDKFYLLKESLFKINSLVILEELTDIQEYKRMSANP